MIVHPNNWRMIGQPVSVARLENTLQTVLSEINCDCLSYSGGLDSSLLLYLMLELGIEVRTFTMTCDENHPDLKYARATIDEFERHFGVEIESHWWLAPTVKGDELVKAFYAIVKLWTDSIIAGDGVDEFMAGYYAHQADPHEDEYYTHLRALQEKHLTPLDQNSGDTRVYLPYMDGRFIDLMTQIPLSEKVNAQNRKMVMVALACGKVPPEVIERKKYGFGTAASVVGGEK